MSLGRPSFARVVAATRAVLLVVSLLGGAYWFFHVVGAHYPVKEWLFWRFAPLWLLSAWFCAACVSTGHLVVRRVKALRLGPGGHLAVSFAVGVFVFFLAMFLLGIPRLWGRVVFFGLPTVMVAAGARSLYRWGARRYRLYLRLRRPLTLPFWFWPLAIYGVIGVALVYAPILSPDNVAYDARWYHLPLAESYAAHGGLFRSPEGWLPAAIPHLASFLYGWCFLLPWGGLFDKVELSSHLEFAVFLWTLALVPSLVRRLVPRSRAGLSWVAVFLFPGIYVYDSTLSTAADHISALWAVPIWLAFLAAFRALDPRACALMAVLCAAAVVTKYTSANLALAPVLGLLARAAWVAARGAIKRDVPFDRRAFLGPLAALGAGLAASAPHWLKNWVFYGDPVYPILHKYLKVRPWTQDSEHWWKIYQSLNWTPQGTVLERMRLLAKVSVNFSFEPHDWPAFHGVVPVFGSLYTLCLLALPWVPGAKRVWGLVFGTQLGVALWFWVNPQDRYLQTLVPWMAVVVAATLVLVVRTNWPTRLAAGILVGAQAVWGGDAWFIQSHAMGATLTRIGDLLGAGYRKSYEARFNVFSPFSDEAKVLPKGSKILYHDMHGHLGSGVVSLCDWIPGAFGVSWARLGNDRAVWNLLRRWGVTHVSWKTNVADEHHFDSLANSLVFFSFVTRYGAETRTFGNLTLVTVPTAAPPDAPTDPLVALYKCDWTYGSGLYQLSDLTVGAPIPNQPPPTYPPPREHWAPNDPQSGPSQVARARYVVVNRACGAVPQPPIAGFVKMATRGVDELWVRATGP